MLQHLTEHKSLECCICRTGESERHYRKVDGFDYLQCAGCGLVYLRTDHMVNDFFYQDTLEKRENDQKVRKHAIEYWSVPRLYSKYQTVFDYFFSDRLQKMVRAGYSGGPVLDVGCGYGFFVRFLKEKGITSTGIDTGEEQVAWACENWHLDVSVSSVEDYVPLKTYDAVIMADVLEHVRDPVEVLKHTQKFLGKDGLLVVQVPNLLGFKLPPGHSWGVPHHLWQFNRKSLANVMRRSGFSVVSTSTGVLGVIGMHERGGPTFREKAYMLTARHLGIGNRLLMIGKKNA